MVKNGDSSNKASILRLKFCNFKLDSLLEITQAINENKTIKFLLEKYESLICNDLKIGKLLVFLLQEGSWKVVLESGFLSGTFAAIKVERDLLEYTDISTTISSSSLLIQVFDLVIPIYHNKKPLAFVLLGDLDEEGDGISPIIKHLTFIQTLTNVIFVAIENKRLFKENLKQEALRRELELATRVQEALVPNPKLFPLNEKIFVDAFYYPHFEVGGDYYDFIQLSANEFGFCIADVSGKGISAALLMSNFQASLRALFTADILLKDLIAKLNDIVMMNTKGDKFITVFLAKFNYLSKELKYINAGHNPPICVEVKSQRVLFLESGCVGLGMLDKIPRINETTLKVNGNTKVLCYTDGLVEIEDEYHNEVGKETIARATARPKRIDQIIEDLVRDLNINKNNTLIFDDITMLGVEFY